MPTIGEDCRSSLQGQGAQVREARQLPAASAEGIDFLLNKEWS